MGWGGSAAWDRGIQSFPGLCSEFRRGQKFCRLPRFCVAILAGLHFGNVCGGLGGMELRGSRISGLEACLVRVFFGRWFKMYIII